MARYYEEETLFQSAKDELLKYFSDSFVYTSAELFHKVLANTPTADVVPKTEVEDAKIKAVATVISEISKMLKSSYNRKHAFVNDEFLRGRDGAYQEFINILTEISRKNADREVIGQISPQTDLTNKCGSCEFAIPIKGSTKGVFGCHIECKNPNKVWRYDSSSRKQRTSPKCKYYTQKVEQNNT